MQTIAARSVALDRGRTIRPAALTIDGEVIHNVEILTAADYDPWCARHPDAVDLGDRFVTPAFINAHTHVVLAFLRGVSARAAAGGNLVEDLFFRLESKLTAGDAAAFARMGAYECLLHGQAVIWDHYYHAEAVADAIADVGLSVVMAPTLQDLSGPGCTEWAEALAATERLAGREGRGGVWAAVGPHATDTVSGVLWGRAAAAAEALHVPLHAHLAQSIDEVRRIHERHGRSPVAWLADLGALDRGPAALLAHGLYVSSKTDLPLLDPQRHILAYCPYSQLIFGFEARVDRWRQAGFRVAVGTDAAASNDSMNVQKELRAFAAMGTRGVSHGEVFDHFNHNGTYEAAEALEAQRAMGIEATASYVSAERVLDAAWAIPGGMHPGFRAGEITPGAMAHLAVWDLDHPAFWPGNDPLGALAFGDTTGALHGLWVGGRPVGTPGQFASSILHSDAYCAAKAEADARWRQLMS